MYVGGNVEVRQRDMVCATRYPEIRPRLSIDGGRTCTCTKETADTHIVTFLGKTNMPLDSFGNKTGRSSNTSTSVNAISRATWPRIRKSFSITAWSNRINIAFSIIVLDTRPYVTARIMVYMRGKPTPPVRTDLSVAVTTCALPRSRTNA